jgi:hypothetical protein
MKTPTKTRFERNATSRLHKAFNYLKGAGLRRRAKRQINRRERHEWKDTNQPLFGFSRHPQFNNKSQQCKCHVGYYCQSACGGRPCDLPPVETL